MSLIHSVFKFDPIYKEKIWGGEKLEKIFGRMTPGGQIGESWEISDYESDISKTSKFLNQSFREIYSQNVEATLGKPFLGQKFPLLIKLIDANDKLSVQVHPDDHYAANFDPSSAGKKECWMVLAADPDAELVIGFENDLDISTYQTLIKNNEAESALKKWKVKPGEVFLLSPGTIHAIGAGIVLLEVQQSSDSTYRVYDYGRVGDDGKLRELHLEKALAVLNFKASDGSEYLNPIPFQEKPFTKNLFTSNDKFRLESWIFHQAQILSLAPLCDPVCFGILHIIKGSVKYTKDNETFRKGDTIFLTAEAFLKSESLEITAESELAFMAAGTDWVKWI